MPRPERPFWHTPAVRHLAWLCRAPTLVNTGLNFSVEQALPADTDKRLARLDQSPETLLAQLGSARRLGHYFEELYHFFLTEILEWPVLLRNAPVRDHQGRTLGELDFVVRNPADGSLQHHEIAVKFYLGLPEEASTLWYGPNAHDRLDLKTQRMLDHQCRMTERPETRALLASAGLTEPFRPAMFMPGNLFYPAMPLTSPALPPEWVNPHHERGYWLRHGDLKKTDTDLWTPVIKPHWLGPFQCMNRPSAAATREAMENVATKGWPQLFARMKPREEGQGFDEVCRYFVVPDHWPQTG